MDFGILLPFRNPAQWHAPITKIYDEHIEEAVLAEELGYDHVWTTEHHFYDDAWSPSLLPILAAIAQRTSRIRLGTFIIILPFHHIYHPANRSRCPTERQTQADGLPAREGLGACAEFRSDSARGAVSLPRSLHAWAYG